MSQDKRPESRTALPRQLGDGRPAGQPASRAEASGHLKGLPSDVDSKGAWVSCQAAASFPPPCSCSSSEKPSWSGVPRVVTGSLLYVPSVSLSLSPLQV
ncbi:mCG1027615 [Mus musculus]|jgi:hypothetical protein|nr:mCG1027615 [Mus musculus]